MFLQVFISFFKSFHLQQLLLATSRLRKSFPRNFFRPIEPPLDLYNKGRKKILFWKKKNSSKRTKRPSANFIKFYSLFCLHTFHMKKGNLFFFLPRIYRFISSRNKWVLKTAKKAGGTFFCRSKFQLIVLRIITENTQISFCAKEAILQIFLNQKKTLRKYVTYSLI